jgi:hypothetical protein
VLSNESFSLGIAVGLGFNKRLKYPLALKMAALLKTKHKFEFSKS